MQGKSHHRGKGRSSTQDVYERGKRSKEPDQLVVVPDASLEISNIHAPRCMSGKANDICTPLYRGKDEGATVSIAYDPSESGAEVTYFFSEKFAFYCTRISMTYNLNVFSAC